MSFTVQPSADNDPGVCCSCGGDEGPFIHLTDAMDGAVYVCESCGCELGRAFGMVSGHGHKILQGRFRESELKVQALEGEIERVRGPQVIDLATARRLVNEAA